MHTDENVWLSSVTVFCWVFWVVDNGSRVALPHANSIPYLKKSRHIVKYFHIEELLPCWTVVTIICSLHKCNSSRNPHLGATFVQVNTTAISGCLMLSFLLTLSSKLKCIFPLKFRVILNEVCILADMSIHDLLPILTVQ